MRKTYEKLPESKPFKGYIVYLKVFNNKHTIWRKKNTMICWVYILIIPRYRVHFAYAAW